MSLRMRLDSLVHVLSWATAVVVTATSIWIAVAIQPVLTLALPAVLSILPIAAPRRYDERARWIAATGIGVWTLISIASVGQLYVPGFLLAASSAFAFSASSRPARTAPIR